ncbi:hypothetical protein HJ526_10045 [Donghicola sp. C2-DW-16]|uniref:ATP/GTP-binding protein n=1 Tax=Donghicola mangrovi TaxID=2729614 RepID=A0ABX2PE48_9RHOB|nr:hypothetical protein [Donghicola mangrovi]NVO27761.1 hypothetical protein [Donghicola mangrovi]
MSLSNWLTLGAVLAGSAAAASPVTIEGFATPESVVLTDTAAFVSNIGAQLDPFSHDGDGFISKLGLDGSVANLHAINGLDSPKGLTVLNGTLYVADIDRILGFDLTTMAQVFNAQVPGDAPMLLNAIEPMGDTLLVSDTLRSTLYSLAPDTGTYTELATGIDGANGITWNAEQNAATIAGVGADFGGSTMYRWSPTEGLSQIPDAPFGFLDGIVTLDDQTVLVSDWHQFDPVPGDIYAVNTANGETKQLDLGTTVRAPADFAYDAANGKIWVPQMHDGRVSIIDLPTE